jgi:hypothetical protein
MDKLIEDHHLISVFQPSHADIGQFNHKNY